MKKKNNDKNTSLAKLQEDVMIFNCLRGWHLGQGFNPKNLASSVVIEAGELLENFQWLSEKEAREIKNDPKKLRAVGLESADPAVLQAPGLPDPPGMAGAGRNALRPAQQADRHPPGDQ